ncbi:MAG: hypothetical protein U0Q18_37025 [Bryobacteraceae bacterium]
MSHVPRAAIVNLSTPHYNLGAEKLRYWLQHAGWLVEWFEGVKGAPPPLLLSTRFDRLCLSAIFSWDVPGAVDLAVHFKPQNEVWAGGPGFLHMGDWWRRSTGLEAKIGLDWLYERQRGNYRMTYAARGCPVGCHFCGVPQLEGTTYTLDWEFEPAPILLDNNLTDEPVEFQEHIIRRYQETGIPLLDANSGFEPRNFTEETYARWKPILRGPWRCGYDYLPERSAVRRMLQILQRESSKKKRVYVLIGNEPIEHCLERVREVIGWGGEPHLQPLLPKNALDRHDYELRYDWTASRLTHFARYWNRRYYKYTPLDAYDCRGKRPLKDLLAGARNYLPVLSET